MIAGIPFILLIAGVFFFIVALLEKHKNGDGDFYAGASAAYTIASIALFLSAA